MVPLVDCTSGSTSSYMSSSALLRSGISSMYFNRNFHVFGLCDRPRSFTLRAKQSWSFRGSFQTRAPEKKEDCETDFILRYLRTDGTGILHGGYSTSMRRWCIGVEYPSLHSVETAVWRGPRDHTTDIHHRQPGVEGPQYRYRLHFVFFVLAPGSR